MLRFCRANRVDYALGVATTTTLRRHIDTLEQSTAARFAAAGGPDKLRRFKEFYDGAASWDRLERIIARIEAGPDGVDTRFIATNLDAGPPRRSIASAAGRRTISNRSRPTWRQTAPLATRRAPTSCGCFCTRAPIG